MQAHCSHLNDDYRLAHFTTHMQGQKEAPERSPRPRRARVKAFFLAPAGEVGNFRSLRHFGISGDERERPPGKSPPSGLKYFHGFRGFRLHHHGNRGITILPKQSSFGWTKEQPMSIKLSFQVRFGKWRLTLSISR